MIQPYQGAYSRRRYSNAAAGSFSGEQAGFQTLGNIPCHLRLESNDLAMGTVSYKVVSTPAAVGSDKEQHTQSINSHTLDMFTLVSKPSFQKGTVVRVTATPTSSRYVLDHFENASGQRLGSNTGAINVTVSSDMTVRAVFRPVNTQQYATLTVSYNHAHGSVTASPALSNDKVTVALGASVVLTATPASGYAFKQWRNVLVGGNTHTTSSSPVHTESMRVGDKTIYADFERVSATPTDPGTGQTQKTVTVKWDNGMGEVSGSGLNVAAGTGTATVNTGDSITLKAAPASGHHFVKWTGGPVDGRTDDKVSFAVKADYAIYAQFAADNGSDPGGGGNGGNGGGGGGGNGGNGGGGSSTGSETGKGATGKVMAFVRKWWWALLIAAYVIYKEGKGAKK